MKHLDILKQLVGRPMSGLMNHRVCPGLVCGYCQLEGDTVHDFIHAPDCPIRLGREVVAAEPESHAQVSKGDTK